MRDIKAVFDIGNDVIKWVVFANDEWKDVVLVKQVEPTQGMRKGKILDSEAFTSTLHKMTESFIKKLGGDFIDEIFIGISHPEAVINRVVEQKRIMREEIEADDVDHLSKVISDVAVKNNFETIKIVPVHRVIDESKVEKDPIGLKGKRLELVADVFMIPKNLYNGLMECFDKLGLSVTDIIPNIISASEVAIDYDHKDLGTVLVDIGKNQTSYVIYEEWYPLGYGTIPIGWEDVTKDISIGMQVDIKEAENIKKSYGSAILDKDTKAEDKSLDMHFLTDIISARYEEIFLKINKHLEELDRDGRLPWGVLLIWGGSKMNNIDALAKHIFKLATFFGRDTQLNLGDLSSNVQFINVLWTYIWSNKYTDGRKSHFKVGFDLLSNVWNFFKDLF